MDIKKYLIKEDISDNPIHGTTRELTSMSDNKDKTIEKAKEMSDKKKNKNIYVAERTYTSQKNLEKRFHLIEMIVWASWL